MKRLIAITAVFIIANALVMSTSIAPASAHGVGGIEPSKTKVEVTSIVPNTNSFSASSIENGDRFKVTRTSAQDVVVLGVDDEPYILINENGTYINSKSATGLINKSTSSDYLRTVSKSDFEKTSVDPNQTPNWEKVNSSQSYAWHDHRTHYMGDVPDGIKDLGTSTVKIKSDNEIYTLTLKFTANEKSTNYFMLFGFLALAIGISMFGLLKKELFKQVVNRKIIVLLLLLIVLFESIHIWGYLAFSQRSYWEEITSTMYSILLTLIATAAFWRIARKSSAKTNWNQQISKQAPLLALTGFVGIFVGAIFEYKTFTYDYLPTIYPNVASKLLVGSIALASLTLLIIGVLNINSGVHNQEQTPVSSS